MKRILGPGVIAGLTLAFALSASGQATSNSATNNAAPTATNAPLSKNYDYGFIEQRFVWSNKPLNTTAGKVCQTMKDKTFNETPYAITDDHDWNSCLAMQVQSIGYLRWLKNSGFKPNRKNRKNAQDYLQKNYTMGPWGTYSFNQLVQAVNATNSSPIHP